MPILNRGLVTAIPLEDNTIRNIASAFCKAPTPYSPALKKPDSAELTGRGGTRERKEWTTAFPSPAEPQVTSYV